MTTSKMRLLAYLYWIIFLPLELVGQQCVVKPGSIPHNDSIVVELGVYDAVFNDLADPRQGVCEVRLDFSHNAILDLEVDLISPSGQVVRLIGPNATINTNTLGGRWKIGFVPCGTPARPDGSFQAKWDNQVNRFPSNNYSGTYYPFEGCLEEFDRGPVNGTWKLKIKTAPTSVRINGLLRAFDIRFCEELGRNCCFPDAGRISGSPILYGCQGDSSLLLSPKAAGSVADTNEYGYTWLLGKDTVLLEIGRQLDLRRLPLGAYEVCGLSYDYLATPDLPVPNGSLRLDTLRTRLNSINPPFCGEMMDTCFRVNVLPAPDTGFIELVLCAGDTLIFGGNKYSAAGQYLVPLTSEFGCDSLVRMQLRLLAPKQTIIDTSICAGNSFLVGNKTYMAAGSYSDTLTAINGCDSIIVLQLSVKSLPQKSDTAYICQGSAYAAGGKVFTKAGDYQVVLPGMNGDCDTTLSLTLFVLSPRIVLGGVRDLTCAERSIVLDASASTPEGSLRYRWEGAGGIILGNQPTLEVNQPGRYVLQIVLESNGAFCASQVTLFVAENYTKPTARIEGVDTISCKHPLPLLTAKNDNPASSALLQWIRPGLFAAPQDTTAQFRVNEPGPYLLVMEDQQSGCMDTARVVVALDTSAPQALAGKDTLLNCFAPVIQLVSGGVIPPAAQYAYLWQTLSGEILSRGVSAQVGAAGTYFLEVTNEKNGCKSTDVVLVGEDFQRPSISIRAPNFACGQDSLLAQALVLPSSSPYRLVWSGPGVVESRGQLRQVIYASGPLSLRAENLRNGCVNEELIFVGQSPCPPCLTGGQQDTITCSRRELRLKVTLCRPCSSCTYSWTATGGGVIIRDGQQLNPVVSGGGTFRLVAKDSNGLETSLTVDVPTDTLSPVTEAGEDKILNCTRKSVALGGRDSSFNNAFSYRWEHLNGSLLPGGNQSFVEVNSPGTYLLAKIAQRNGCIGRDSVEVTQDTLPPRADAGETITLTCSAPRVSLDGRNSASGFSIQYRWEAMEGGNIVAGKESIAPLVDAAGWYRLQVTDTVNGCIALDSVQVLAALDGPPLAPIQDQVINCRDSVARLEAKLPDSKPYRFCWRGFGPGSDTLCQSSLFLDVRKAGTWVFELTDQTTGCKTTRTARVQVDTVPPFFEVGIPDTFRCNYVEIALSGRTLLPSSGYEVMWSSGEGLILSGQNTLTPLTGAPGLYTGRLRSLSNFCIATKSVRVYADTLRPEATAGPDSTLTCRNSTLRLKGSAGSASSGLDWNWTTPDGAIEDDAGSLNPLVSKKGSYILIVRNLRNGCSQQDTAEVKDQTQPPVLLLNTPGPYILTCSSDTLLLDGNPSRSPFGSSLQLSWRSFGGGEFTQDIPGRIIARKPGRYRMVARDLATGCSDSLELQVTADFIQPLVNFKPTVPITCSLRQVVLEASIGGPGIRHAFRWEGPGGIRVQTDTAMLSVTLPGSYTLTVVNENTGCFSVQQVIVPADTSPPAIVTGNMDVLDCDTRSVRIDGSASEGRNLSFSWVALEGGFESLPVGPVAVTSREGRYVLLLKDGVNGCVAEDTFFIEEKGVYIDSVIFSITPPGCGQGGRLSVATVEGGTPPFRFRLDNRLSDPAGNFINIPPGKYRFQVSDSEGCTWASEVEMTPPQRITADLGPDRDIFRGDSVKLEALVAPQPDGMRFQWTGGVLPALDTSGSALVVRPLQTTTYQVIAKAPNGCTATDEVTISVLTDLPAYMPTAFSPNGDGQNDVFFIQAGNRVQQIRSFRIFNRWGTQVFEKSAFLPNDPAFGWDGRHREQELPAGVYIFIAILKMSDGREETLKGEFILMK